jgi:hypothetical protein
MCQFWQSINVMGLRDKTRMPGAGASAWAGFCLLYGQMQKCRRRVLNAMFDGEILRAERKIAAANRQGAFE